MHRLRLAVLPPAAALLVGVAGAQVEEFLWQRRATPDQLMDDAASALLGRWLPLGAAALALFTLHLLVVLPVLRATRHRAGARPGGMLGVAGALALAATAAAVALLHDGRVDTWPATFGATVVLAGLPTLVLGLVTARLLGSGSAAV